jgi:choline-sulfatase
MSSVLEAGPCVRTNQLDFDDEVIYKSTQYLYDHARYRGDQPFCLTVSMTHPHDPYAMTKDYWDLYEGVDIPLPTTPAIPHDKQDPHSKRVLQCIDLYGREIPIDKIRAARRAYFAACTYVDAQVGKLIRTLDACGFADDTVVVFTGDHGDMLGERGLWYKMVWFEMAARVPMVVYAPGRYSPRRVQENVSSMDLLPTFVAIAGGAVHPCLPLDGVSLIPYLTGKVGITTDRVILGEYMAEGTLCPVVMIRRGRWKFIYSPLDPPMLFDLVSDPAESVNLVTGCNIPSHSTVKASLGPPSLHLPYNAPAKLHSAPFPAPNLSPAPRNVPAQVFSQADLTPPLTPPITHHLPSTEPSALVSQFLEEVRARWDFDGLTQMVLASQRRRRLVYDALIRGTPTTWEYAPPSTSQNYVRNRGKGALDDVEWLQRLPRISK